MKTIAIIILCLVLGTAAMAQQVPVITSQQTTNANLENMPLKQAIQQMLQYMGGEYTLSPALDAPPYDKIVVNLRVQNASWNDVLTNVLRTNNLEIVSTGENKGIVQPIPSPKSAQAQVAMAPAVIAPPDLVTLNVLPMPVKDALALVCPACGWTFGDNLGRMRMPGAKFYQFPREMAAAVLLTAAGLVPPSGKGAQVTSKGKTDLAQTYQYMPQKAQVQSNSPQGGYAPQNYLNANQAAGGISQAQKEGVSLAAYMRGNQQQFTILANGAVDTVLLERLLSLSGKSYVMGDLSLRPDVQVEYYDKSSSAARSEDVKSELVFAKPKAITAQLRDVTLEQALDNLLPACRLKYRKVGLASSPTYMIETLPLPSQGALGVPASSDGASTPK